MVRKIMKIFKLKYMCQKCFLRPKTYKHLCFKCLDKAINKLLKEVNCGCNTNSF